MDNDSNKAIGAGEANVAEEAIEVNKPNKAEEAKANETNKAKANEVDNAIVTNEIEANVINKIVAADKANGSNEAIVAAEVNKIVLADKANMINKIVATNKAIVIDTTNKANATNKAIDHCLHCCQIRIICRLLVDNVFAIARYLPFSLTKYSAIFAEVKKDFGIVGIG
jgi:hypothetical protein